MSNEYSKSEIYSKVLLEAPEDIKAASYLNINNDNKLVSAALREAQDSHLIEIIGSALMERLQELVYNSIQGQGDNIEEYEEYQVLLEKYVHPYLEAKVQALLPLMTTFKTRNLGLTTSGDDNIRAASMDEVYSVQRRFETVANQKATALSKYLCAKKDAFPELSYTNCNCGVFIKPKIGVTFSNIPLFLGSAGRCGC